MVKSVARPPHCDTRCHSRLRLPTTRPPMPVPGERGGRFSSLDQRIGRGEMLLRRFGVLTHPQTCVITSRLQDFNQRAVYASERCRGLLHLGSQDGSGLIIHRAEECRSRRPRDYCAPPPVSFSEMISYGTKPPRSQVARAAAFA